MGGVQVADDRAGGIVNQSGSAGVVFVWRGVDDDQDGFFHNHNATVEPDAAEAGLVGCSGFVVDGVVIQKLGQHLMGYILEYATEPDHFLRSKELLDCRAVVFVDPLYGLVGHDVEACLVNLSVGIAGEHPRGNRVFAGEFGRRKADYTGVNLDGAGCFSIGH